MLITHFLRYKAKTCSKFLKFIAEQVYFFPNYLLFPNGTHVFKVTNDPKKPTIFSITSTNFSGALVAKQKCVDDK